jgi:hypothetical protein
MVGISLGHKPPTWGGHDEACTNRGVNKEVPAREELSIAGVKSGHTFSGIKQWRFIIL